MHVVNSTVIMAAISVRSIRLCCSLTRRVEKNPSGLVQISNVEVCSVFHSVFDIHFSIVMSLHVIPFFRSIFTRQPEYSGDRKRKNGKLRPSVRIFAYLNLSNIIKHAENPRASPKPYCHPEKSFPLFCGLR